MEEYMELECRVVELSQQNNVLWWGVYQAAELLKSGRREAALDILQMTMKEANENGG